MRSIVLLASIALITAALVGCGTPGSHSHSVWPAIDYTGTYAEGTTGKTITLTKDAAGEYDVTTSDGIVAHIDKLGQTTAGFTHDFPVSAGSHVVALFTDVGGALRIRIDGVEYSLGHAS